MEKMRLDKFLSTYTELSRKDAKKWIRKGEVCVDGEVVSTETQKVMATQNICLKGEQIVAKEYVYLMMNKPCGVLSATKDRVDRTVLDLIAERKQDLFPVGRLDKDTEGFLLLTNDGELAHRLLSPTYHVPKTYYLEYEGELLPDAIAMVKEGIEIGEKRPTKPGELRLLEKGKAELIISEGKFHQVKRMIAALGGKVTYLKRMSMAGLLLDEDLEAGQYRELTEEEILTLKKSAEKRQVVE